MEFAHTGELAKGLLAGWLTDQIGRGRDIPRIVSASVIAIGVVLMLGAGGGVRGLGIVLIMLGLIAFMLVLLVRRVARLLIRQFAEPASLAGKREQIDAVAAASSLPRRSPAIVWLLRQRHDENSDLYGVARRMELEVIAGGEVRDVPPALPAHANPELSGGDNDLSS